MTVIKINKNSKGDGFKDFVYWLQEDLNCKQISFR